MNARTVVAGSAALVMAVGLSACSKGLKEKTLRFTEKDRNEFGFADNAPKAKVGPQGPDMLTDGDALTFSNDVVDSSGRDIGDLDATCTATRKGRFDQANVTCQGHSRFPRARSSWPWGARGHSARGRQRVRWWAARATTPARLGPSPRWASRTRRTPSSSSSRSNSGRHSRRPFLA